MKRYLWVLLAVALVALVIYRVNANTVVNQAVTRLTGIAVDNTSGLPPAQNGKNIYGIYLGTASPSSATTGTVTLTGASTSAHVWGQKKTTASATYIKGVSMSSAGVATYTMSGSTTDDLEFIAIDYGVVTY